MFISGFLIIVPKEVSKNGATDEYSHKERVNSENDWITPTNSIFE